MKTHKPPRVIQPALVDSETDDELLAYCQSRNFWDTLQFRGGPGRWSPSTRLFGNANVGTLSLTNLQVGGQISPYGTTIVTNWYARTDIPIEAFEQLRAGFAQYAASSFATLVIGNRVAWCMPVSDLMRSWNEPGSHRSAHPLWPLVIPDRQTVQVTVDTFNSAADALITDLAGEYQPWSRLGRPYGLAVHLEGIHLPREIYEVADSTDDVDAQETNLKWRRMVARLVKLLTRTERTHQNTVEHIASWVGGLANGLPDEAAAQVTAIADALREGRAGKPTQSPPADQDFPF